MSKMFPQNSHIAIALAPGALFTGEGQPKIELKGREWPLTINEHNGAWEEIAKGDVDFDAVLDKMIEQNVSSHYIATFINIAHQAMALGWLEYRLISESKILATLRPIGKLQSNPLGKAALPEKLFPSRFSTARMDSGHIHVKNSRFGHALDVYDPTLIQFLFSEFNQNTGATNQIELFVKLAFSAGLLIDTDAVRHEETPHLGFWESHEMDFHNQSRLGANLNTVGGVFSWKGVVPSLPALKVADSTRTTIKLPAAQNLPATSLAHVINERKSIREHAGRVMTIQDISNFLWHTLRVMEVLEPNEATGLFYEASVRPYPCGGAAYELEVYVTTLGFDGVPAGVWWYDPLNHSLELRTDKNDLLLSLLQTASNSAAGAGMPQVLLLITSRLGRLNWKYRSISYAVTLKHTGVLYQMFYMVATALGLAPCGLGVGNSALVNMATDTDPNAEAPVGEFMLGGISTNSY
jgi:SagB-type dehydrogenase family enzyme